MTEPASNSSLSRREFLRLAAALGGAAALASFLEACSQAGIDPRTLLTPTGAPHTPTPYKDPATATSTATEKPSPTETEIAPSATPTETIRAETAPDGKARIAFVKADNRAEGVRKALDLLGINPVAGKKVFLKPNFNSADPAPGSTHPDTFIALVTALQAMGAQRITVGDRSGMGDTRQVMQQVGVFKLAGELGFETLVFDELAPEDWVMIRPSGSHWNNGFPFARPCLEAEALVQTCNLKTHRYGGHFTLSLKNSVGMVGKRRPQRAHDFMQELHNSAHQRRMIAEINTAYTPALIVLDGVEAFISGGPDVGERVTPEVILAGTDRVALDATGVALLRYFGCKTEAGQGKIFAQGQIARAVELGLGIDDPRKIEFLTEDADSAAYSDKIKEILLGG